MSERDKQYGGDHYKKLGAYQPWEVLKAWLTPEEFRGYMKGTAIAYLAREQSKGGDLDIAKAMHTLAGFLEMAEVPAWDEKPPAQEPPIVGHTGAIYAQCVDPMKSGLEYY